MTAMLPTRRKQRTFMMKSVKIGRLFFMKSFLLILWQQDALKLGIAVTFLILDLDMSTFFFGVLDILRWPGVRWRTWRRRIRSLVLKFAMMFYKKSS